MPKNENLKWGRPKLSAFQSTGTNQDQRMRSTRPIASSIKPRRNEWYRPGPRSPIPPLVLPQRGEVNPTLPKRVLRTQPRTLGSRKVKVEEVGESVGEEERL